MSAGFESRLDPYPTEEPKLPPKVLLPLLALYQAPRSVALDQVDLHHADRDREVACSSSWAMCRLAVHR